MPYDHITQTFIDRHPDKCSNVLITPRQKLWYAGIIALLLFGIAYRWDIAFCLVNIVLALWYFSIILFRTAMVLFSVLGFGEEHIGPEEVAKLNDADLPVYTILLPLYREAAVAEQLIGNLNRLDYPADKLDIKILLEEDDAETREAIDRAKLPPGCDIIVVPDSLPKTKPKACNHGLERAKGEFCVIFDAEDRPDPDQLKKVVCAFRDLPDDVACLQARLNYYNARQNLLTRLFTIEYSTTFDLFLPGLQTARVPIPLGGTSNHFRTKVLQDLEGWDPFNVTEDCDLGIRLYRLGMRTEMIDSTTWEEATSRLGNWIRQRSRWVKGFFQTHLTHTRHPLRTLRELGPWGMFGFLLNVGGTALMMVLNVFYWLFAGVYLSLLVHARMQGHGLWEAVKGPREWFADNPIWPMIYYGPLEDPLWSTLSIVFFFIACILLAANLLFVFMHVVACLERRSYRLLPYTLLMPFYWVLISIGAWKGFLQLFFRPFYWEKTMHGEDKAEGC